MKSEKEFSRKIFLSPLFSATKTQRHKVSQRFNAISGKEHPSDLTTSQRFNAISGKEHPSNLTTFQKLSNLSGY